PTLYDAIQKAKKSSGPERQHRARSQAGRWRGSRRRRLADIMYEGYGPNGVAVLIECLTDNRNRAAGEGRTAPRDDPQRRQHGRTPVRSRTCSRARRSWCSRRTVAPRRSAGESCSRRVPRDQRSRESFEIGARPGI
ncbi:hypothetical protein GS444_20240, partial [Rhodococcus hoagii]|nr:hypothetical protein [Prescottella equi]